MRRPDQARARSAASLIRHEANKKLTTMAALAFTVNVPAAHSPSSRVLRLVEKRGGFYVLPRKLLLRLIVAR